MPTSKTEELTDILMTLVNVPTWFTNKNNGSEIIRQAVLKSPPSDELLKAVDSIEALIAHEVKESEQNAVAWTIGVIDDLHIATDSDLNTNEDKIYKGIKNTIRDRFKFFKGVDPAPKYPINAELSKPSTVGDE